MTILKPRYSKEEFARRGTELYEQVVRPTVGPDDQGKFVAIDIESGEFEIDEDDYTAGRRLRDRMPESQTWIHCIGADSAYFIGSASARVNSE